MPKKGINILGQNYANVTSIGCIVSSLPLTKRMMTNPKPIEYVSLKWLIPHDYDPVWNPSQSFPDYSDEADIIITPGSVVSFSGSIRGIYMYVGKGNFVKFNQGSSFAKPYKFNVNELSGTEITFKPNHRAIKGASVIGRAQSP